MVTLSIDGWFFIEAATGGNVSFDADNRLNAGFGAGNIKLDSAIKIAVIGQSNRRHVVLFGLIDHVVKFRQAVKQAVVTVVVQVDEIGWHNREIIAKNTTVSYLLK